LSASKLERQKKSRRAIAELPDAGSIIEGKKFWKQASSIIVPGQKLAKAFKGGHSSRNGKLLSSMNIKYHTSGVLSLLKAAQEGIEEVCEQGLKRSLISSSSSTTTMTSTTVTTTRTPVIIDLTGIDDMLPLKRKKQKTETVIIEDEDIIEFYVKSETPTIVVLDEDNS